MGGWRSTLIDVRAGQPVTYVPRQTSATVGPHQVGAERRRYAAARDQTLVDIRAIDTVPGKPRIAGAKVRAFGVRAGSNLAAVMAAERTFVQVRADEPRASVPRVANARVSGI